MRFFMQKAKSVRLGIVVLLWAAPRLFCTHARLKQFIFTCGKANDNGEEPHLGVGKSVFLDGKVEILSDGMYQ